MTIEEAMAWVDLCAGIPSPVIAKMSDAEILVKCLGTQDALAAEVRRLNAMRCETCKHQRCYGDYEECDRTQGDDYGNRTECKTMGGGCLAWEGRDAD